jgi:hypothetical protein
MRRAIRRIRLAACGAFIATLASACGGSSPASPSSPTTPTPVVTNVAGAWTGTWIARRDGYSVSVPITVTFTQAGSEAQGTIRSSESPATAAATLQLSGSSVAGNVQMVYLSGCQTKADVVGSVESGRLRFATSSVPAPGGEFSCDWAPIQEFDLRR